MRDFSDLLVPAAVATGVAPSLRRPLIAHAARLVAAAHGLDAATVLAALDARERLGSTGFGHGVAIPHARLATLDQPVGAFLRLDQPVAFGAVDGLPVDLAFVLVSPVGAGAIHLKALARISRALRDQAFLAKLRGAASADALYALLANDDAA